MTKLMDRSSAALNLTRVCVKVKKKFADTLVIDLLLIEL
jgi:hypothetical protein